MASEYLGPDGVWYPVGQGPNPNGTAPIDRPLIDTGLTQTPKIATPYTGPSSPVTSALRGSDAYSSVARRGLDPGMSPFLSSLSKQLAPADPGPGEMLMSGGAGAGQGRTQDIIDQAGSGLADTLKDVASERATASPRAMLQALGGPQGGPVGALPGDTAWRGSEEQRRRRRQFGAPVNMQALLSQL